jgi:galactokinase
VTPPLPDLARAFVHHAGSLDDVLRWFVPGRIELLGKHTDYGGGRSLLATVDRGFHVLARPRGDRVVRVLDARSQAGYAGRLDAELPHAPGQWMDYIITVLRRVARDWPDADRGMDLVFASTLPSASGLSSSSAFVIAILLPLLAFNRDALPAAWHETIRDEDALAGYLGALENGKGFGPFPPDHGVGTHGGSQDQTAILRCRRDEIAQYRWLPVGEEARIPFPEGWELAVASSAVPAAKTGAVKSHYNALAAEHAALRARCIVSGLLAAWRRTEVPDATSLLDLAASPRSVREAIAREAEGTAGDAAHLGRRLEQFREECLELIPEVAAAFAAGEPAGAARAIARSHQLTEEVLRNQVPETMHLARSAVTAGAVAASAFGAGFGGSVWALVETARRDAMLRAWREDYAAHFPARVGRAAFFSGRPGVGAGPA